LGLGCRVQGIGYRRFEARVETWVISLLHFDQTQRLHQVIRGGVGSDGGCAEDHAGDTVRGERRCGGTRWKRRNGGGEDGGSCGGTREGLAARAVVLSLLLLGLRRGGRRRGRGGAGREARDGPTRYGPTVRISIPRGGERCSRQTAGRACLPRLPVDDDTRYVLAEKRWARVSGSKHRTAWRWSEACARFKQKTTLKLTGTHGIPLKFALPKFAFIQK